jgi:NAD(P)H dehydrogenase (quinone)
MSKVLVLYYSSCGHIEVMASAVAEGAREAGAQVDIKRLPELVPDEVARNMHFKFDQAAPVAKVDDLAAYDAIIIGAGTRFGRLSSQTYAVCKRARWSALPGPQDCRGR